MNDLDVEALRIAFDSCTWGNSAERVDDWVRIMRGNDERAQQRIFKKLFLESSNASLIRSLFTKDQIQAFLKDLDKPLHRSHLERRRKVWRFLFLGERVPIPELDWIYRQ